MRHAIHQAHSSLHQRHLQFQPLRNGVNRSSNIRTATSVLVLAQEQFLCSKLAIARSTLKTQAATAVYEDAKQSVSRPQEATNDTLPFMWAQLASAHGDVVASVDPHRREAPMLTYSLILATDAAGSLTGLHHRQLHEVMLDLAAGLQALGLRKGDKASLFSETSSRWIIADQAIMMTGAADAVRGSSAPADELMYIARHSESSAMIVQDAETLDRLVPALQEADAPKLRFIVVMWGKAGEKAVAAVAAGQLHGAQLLTWDDAVAKGSAARATASATVPVPCSHSDMATLSYTSGTTGHPRGVVLTHGNLWYQTTTMQHMMEVSAGQTSMIQLPLWHIYQRLVGYHQHYRATRVVYTNIRRLRDDLTTYKPDLCALVPLILDTLQKRVQQKLRSLPEPQAQLAEKLVPLSVSYVRAMRVLDGVAVEWAVKQPPLQVWLNAVATAALLAPVHALATQLIYKPAVEAIGVAGLFTSAGGALPPALDEFFEAVGVRLTVVYGLTETAPMLTGRVDKPKQNVRGTIGPAFPRVELRVVDPDTLKDVPDGTPGLMLARSPGVMPGYYNDPEATAKAMRAGDGWFDTGDLAMRAPAVPWSSMAGNIQLTGRAKDTIVLSNGKNVEPQPIEDACMASQYIRHCILIGQDKRELGALVFPDQEVLDQLAAKLNQTELSSSELESLLKKEVSELNAARLDYHPYEHIVHIAVVHRPLSVEDGTLTRSMKPRRPEIMKQYSGEVKALLGKLRGG